MLRGGGCVFLLPVFPLRTFGRGCQRARAHCSASGMLVLVLTARAHRMAHGLEELEDACEEVSTRKRMQGAGRAARLLAALVVGLVFVAGRAACLAVGSCWAAFGGGLRGGFETRWTWCCCGPVLTASAKQRARAQASQRSSALGHERFGTQALGMNALVGVLFGSSVCGY